MQSTAQINAILNDIMLFTITMQQHKHRQTSQGIAEFLARIVHESHHYSARPWPTVLALPWLHKNPTPAK
jgi:hypothetical protein